MSTRLFRITILVLLIIGVWGTARVQDRFEVVDSEVQKLIRNMSANICRIDALSRRVAGLIIPTDIRIQDDLYCSVVVVMDKGGNWSSGFAISENEILTARHAVESSSPLKIIADDKSEFEVISVVKHPELDLAVVKIRESIFIPLKLNLQWNPMPGDRLFAIGTPESLDHFNILTMGIVAGVDRSSEIVQGWSNLFIVDMTLAPGSSGCPIFNEDNEVMGVFVGGYMPTINYCIPLNVIAGWNYTAEE